MRYETAKNGLRLPEGPEDPMHVRDFVYHYWHTEVIIEDWLHRHAPTQVRLWKVVRNTIRGWAYYHGNPEYSKAARVAFAWEDFKACRYEPEEVKSHLLRGAYILLCEKLNEGPQFYAMLECALTAGNIGGIDAIEKHWVEGYGYTEDPLRPAIRETKTPLLKIIDGGKSQNH